MGNSQQFGNGNQVVKPQSFNFLATLQWRYEGDKLYGSLPFNLKNSLVFSKKDIISMSGKVAIVTGANQGIGFATSEELAKLDAEVHMICRDEAKCSQAKDLIIASTKNQKIFAHQCDVSLFESIKRFSAEFSNNNEKLDVLVHHGGSIPVRRKLTSEGKEEMMATALGAVLMTDLLVPLLQKPESGGRVVIVSNGSAVTVKARLDDLNTDIMPYDGNLIHTLSKRNQIELTEMLASKLKDKNIVVNSMHPGWVNTDFLRNSSRAFYDEQKSSLRSPQQAADTIVYLASTNSSRVKTGEFWFDRFPSRTHMLFAFTALNTEEKRRLWQNTKAYVGGLKHIIDENEDFLKV